MAFAVSPHEVRVAEILMGSASGMTAPDILNALRQRFNMVKLATSDVMTVLYSTPAYASYTSSAGSVWYVRGSEAEKMAVAPPTAGSTKPISDLCNIPPLGALPDDEFAGKAVVLGGDCNNPAAVRAVVDDLRRRKATIYCLAAQAAGGHALGLSGTAEVDTGPYETRHDLAVAHARILELTPPPVALILAEGEGQASFPVHHLLATFETQKKPVFLAARAADLLIGSDCGAC